ncbi:MAG: amidohydrolase family protein [Proteobacteria bacterium]|nr:amidohydrolase family protein [Pseudomonadota bacterium]MCP4919059.1 amidohydrolase family protein [Pseudomonadota bacterium]
MLFKDCWLDGRRTDLRVEDGLITAIGELSAQPGERVHRGGTVCPHLAEPHVHLDAALLGRRAPNVSGTLEEGIRNWAALRDGLGRADVKARARQTLEMYARWGCTRVRTHVDTGCLENVAALIELRDELVGEGDSAELQVVAFPQEGILTSPERTALWREAVAMGCDAVGAIPHFEPTRAEGDRSLRMACELAAEGGLYVDVHCDERDSGEFRHLLTLCDLADEYELGPRIIAGHCTAMHQWPDDVAAHGIERVRESGVQVVTNPLDNIVLQGRGTYPRPRGHTRVDELWAAGASVGIGHDSVIDPWYRLGTANLVDAAYMLVHYAHLTSEAQMVHAFTTLAHENHRCFGSTPRLVVGEPAALLYYDASDPTEVLRMRPEPMVLR